MVEGCIVKVTETFISKSEKAQEVPMHSLGTVRRIDENGDALILR